MEYYIFPRLPDNLREPTKLHQQMVEVHKDINAIVKEKTLERSYLWHKDEFKLQIRTGSPEERLLNEETNPEEETNMGIMLIL